MNNIQSRSASLGADTYTVGSDYSGIVTKQYVTVGEHVKTGQPLFRIKSTVLSTDLSNGTITKNDLAFAVDSDNQIVLEATNAGTVSTIDYREGAFVPANKEVAAVTRDNSSYVIAKFDLNPPDYARIHTGDTLRVTLPNNQKVSAVIYSLTVEKSGDDTLTIITARIKNFSNSQFSAGTPVSAQLQLKGKSLYASSKETLQRLLKPKG
ncbi:HlyD family efflux transporter periplasmic adaptor subunit [Candidatus Saccharibacteria bacterium]|nr:HlyD family efflux transporter periplasmic adaptor subunit [Candidatus Saccharibacteria bacterium]